MTQTHATADTATADMAYEHIANAVRAVKNMLETQTVTRLGEKQVDFCLFIYLAVIKATLVDTGDLVRALQVAGVAVLNLTAMNPRETYEAFPEPFAAYFPEQYREFSRQDECAKTAQ